MEQKDPRPKLPPKPRSGRSGSGSFTLGVFGGTEGPVAEVLPKILLGTPENSPGGPCGARSKLPHLPHSLGGSASMDQTGVAWHSGGDPTTTPPLSVDTCKGGVLRNREEDFVDEEEEEEEKENAQQASGESILPGSQDLFITLEPIPSQGGIPTLKLEKAALLQMFQRSPIISVPEASADKKAKKLHLR
ncbi:hypothetical protein UY3_04518 [Chelonia mydas]|uniref:Uncharacterized protein n=1 Tax=Chelonia mydas TaxID=8469 RepID=M7BM60_CHEMY|nr:hypothetical protein UY3_04518 [Chelonia mydas]